MISPEYLAGFFDGEGTFYLGVQVSKTGKVYQQCKVMLSQSGEDGYTLLYDIMTQYGGTLYQHLEAGQHKATKPAYKLYWNQAEAIPLCRILIPHLILKQQAAQNALDYMTRKQ